MTCNLKTYNLKPATCFSNSQPIREFHRKNVIPTRIEDPPQVATEAEITKRFESLAALLPDHEQRRPGPVFPSEHRVRSERADVEVAIPNLD